MTVQLAKQLALESTGRAKQRRNEQAAAELARTIGELLLYRVADRVQDYCDNLFQDNGNLTEEGMYAAADAMVEMIDHVCFQDQLCAINRDMLIAFNQDL